MPPLTRSRLPTELCGPKNISIIVHQLGPVKLQTAVSRSIWRHIRRSGPRGADCPEERISGLLALSRAQIRLICTVTTRSRRLYIYREPVEPNAPQKERHAEADDRPCSRGMGRRIGAW
jgi:hypothetical protein